MSSRVKSGLLTWVAICTLAVLRFGTKLYSGPGEMWVRHHAVGLLYVVFWSGCEVGIN